MYRVAVLTDTKDQGRLLAGWVEKAGKEHGMFWCSDLDFSLQAYRLRADHFIPAQPVRKNLKKGCPCGLRGGA